jgi:aromatic ring-opening dioxygenase catalytic subunit (LigB family)
MKEAVLPHVPIMLNTFFPPNQPPAARCYKLGKAIRKAVEAWESDARVAIIGSGGLSHFVIDEEMDDKIIKAMDSFDEATLGAIPESYLQSGSSEIKNWIAMTGAVAGTGLTMELVDYIPCYRSEAGTGTAQGFAYWD